MGSIADLLGDQLRAGLAQLVDPDASDEAPDAASASSEIAVETAQGRAREAAMEAVLDEVELDPADARGELTLRGDLDMDDVSLYAVVARVEREAKVTLNDSQVEEWVTLADLLDAVSDAVSNH
ncbi:MAG: acyl carrier protein [Actinomyces sp.]|nr:acyl carrier protein [Actinomyces sp.]